MINFFELNYGLFTESTIRKLSQLQKLKTVFPGFSYRTT